jgi:L-amino acid N-acyltransferase YncA
MGGNIAYGDEVGRWVGDRVRGGFDREHSQAIGLIRSGKLCAGVIYEQFNGRSVVCHIAVDGRLTPEFLFVIFDYPFRQLGVASIIVPVARTNTKSVRFVTRMGFAEVACLPDAHPTGDILLFMLAREKCRFTGDKYGQRFASTASDA